MFNRAIKSVIAIAALSVVAVPSAYAQLVNGKWQAPAKSGTAGAAAPRQGTEVRPAQRETPRATLNNGAVPLRVIRAVLMSDGSIVADFGFGLERVVRACSSEAANMPLRIVASGSANSQPVPQLQPVPGMQPAPAQMTASQQMAQHAPSQAAQVSCHLRDQSGHIFATR